METNHSPRGLFRLLAAQTQVAFNDNAAKLALMGLAPLVLPLETAGPAVSLLAALLVAPYILFAPVAGWLGDRFSKKHVVTGSLVLQIAVMGIILAAAAGRSFPGLMAGFFLLGLQSTLMSPAKRGLLREVVGTDGLGKAVGWMEMLVVVAILAGNLAGGSLIDGLTERSGNPWNAALWSTIILGAGCVLSLAVFMGVPARKAASRPPFHAALIFGHFHQLGLLRKQPGLFKAALGEAAFYFIGGTLTLVLAQVGRELHPGETGGARAAGIMLAVVGIGIMAGALTAGQLCRHQVRLGLIPMGAFGLFLSLALASVLPVDSMAFYASLMAIGLSGGLFLIPIGTYLLDRSDEANRGGILAATNLLSSLAGILAVALQALMSATLHWSASAQFLVLSLTALGVALYLLRILPDALLRLIGLGIATLHYRVRVAGAERFPKDKGVLLVCNHVSYVDTLVLSLACPRPVRFLSHEKLFRVPVLGSLLNIFGAIPVSPLHAKDAIVKASNAIRIGEVVCIFPEGKLTRTGALNELKSGFELIAHRAACPVVVAHLDGLWGSIFSFAGGRFFWKWPRRLRLDTAVSFSPPVPAETATTAEVRTRLMDLGADAFIHRRECREPLSLKLVRGLSSKPWKNALTDAGANWSSFRRGTLLALSWSLAGRWNKSIRRPRVGIILPPGIAGTAANLAVVLAGKIPVNLNPTMGSKALRSCIAQANLGALVTATPVLKKHPHLMDEPNIIDIAPELRAATGPRLGWRWAAVMSLPSGLLHRSILNGRQLPDPGEEAVLLFTSGSSGMPKGVPLTHQNICGNLSQIASTSAFGGSDILLGSLPLFHSLGLTIGLWLPLSEGIPLVAVPSPLESRTVGEATARGRATVLVATPTFLRAYLRKISPESFTTLRWIVTGAERLPEDLAAEVKSRFGTTVSQGYGLTETSPVAALGITGAEEAPPSTSVGRLLPGMSCRFLHPETRDPVPAGNPGLLAVRGANIFHGYLNRPDATSGALDGGWFLTGDIARLDAGNFLHLEGRLSRFSKIGGEMVPHGAVEDAITRVLPPLNGRIEYVVIGVPDEQKGEHLVLLTTRDVEAPLLAGRLRDAGLPSLWIPKHIHRVPEIPVLTTGKLDLSACHSMVAREGKTA